MDVGVQKLKIGLQKEPLVIVSSRKVVGRVQFSKLRSDRKLVLTLCDMQHFFMTNWNKQKKKKLICKINLVCPTLGAVVFSGKDAFMFMFADSWLLALTSRLFCCIEQEEGETYIGLTIMETNGAKKLHAGTVENMSAIAI